MKASDYIVVKVEPGIVDMWSPNQIFQGWALRDTRHPETKQGLISLKEMQLLIGHKALMTLAPPVAWGNTLPPPLSADDKRCIPIWMTRDEAEAVLVMWKESMQGDQPNWHVLSLMWNKLKAENEE